jgi:transposase-like protein
MNNNKREDKKMTIECDICCEKTSTTKYKSGRRGQWEYYCSDCDLEYAYENRHFEQDDIVEEVEAQ